MAILFDNSSIASTGWLSVSTYSWTHIVSGSDTFLVVSIFTSGTTDIVSGVTYAGIPMTRLTLQLDSGSANYLYTYYIVNPATGTNSVTVNLTTTAGATDAGALSYTGVLQTGQPEVYTSNNTVSGGIQTATVTTLTDNDWLVGSSRSNGAGTAGTNTLIRESNSGGFIIMDSNSNQTPIGSHSLNVNISTNNDYMIIGMAIAPSIPPTPTVHPSFLLNFLQ